MRVKAEFRQKNKSELSDIQTRSDTITPPKSIQQQQQCAVEARKTHKYRFL